MARPIKYHAGDTAGPDHCRYFIAARTDNPRIVFVRCQHEGCEELFPVQMAGVLNGNAKRWCDRHRQQRMAERVSRRRLDKQQRDAVAEIEARRVAGEQVVVTATPLAGYYEPLDRAAHRIARSQMGLGWNSYRREGRCYGWMIVNERATTAGGSVRWDAMCALCGHVHRYQDSQLDRDPIPLCRGCMGTAKWKLRAAEWYKTCAAHATRTGHDITDPRVLLKYATRYGEDWKHEVPARAGLSASLFLTLEAMIPEEKKIVAQALQPADQRAAIAPTPPRNLDTMPYSEWTDAELDAHHSDIEYVRKLYATSYGRAMEFIAEYDRRKALRESNKD